jgi:hypothetical protein
MFFMFGWLKETRPVREVGTCYCYVCLRPQAWELWRETEWVTFSRQRVLPFLCRDMLVCARCQDVARLGWLQSYALRHRAVPSPLEGFIHPSQLAGKSDMQRRYLESLRQGRPPPEQGG